MISSLNDVRTVIDLGLKDVNTTHKNVRVISPFLPTLAAAIALGETVGAGIETISKLKVDSMNITFVRANPEVSGAGDAAIKGNITFVHADGKTVEMVVYDAVAEIADSSHNGLNENHQLVKDFAQMLIANGLSLQTNLSPISTILTEVSLN